MVAHFPYYLGTGSKIDLQKKKDHCVSGSQVLVRMTVHVDQYFLILFGMPTNFQNTQTSVAQPTYRLRTVGLAETNGVRRYKQFGHVFKTNNDDVLRIALDFKVFKRAWATEYDTEKVCGRKIVSKLEDATDRTEWRNAVYELSRTAPINSRLNVVVGSPTPFGLGRNGC